MLDSCAEVCSLEHINIYSTGLIVFYKMYYAHALHATMAHHTSGCT